MGFGDLWVGNLPYDSTEPDIRALCRYFGDIDNLELHKDPKTGRSMGWVFCRYKDHESAVLAKEILDGLSFSNRTLSVQWAAHRSGIASSGCKDTKQQGHLMLQQEIARMTLSDLSALILEIETAVTHHRREIDDVIQANPQLLQSYEQAREVHQSLML